VISRNDSKSFSPKPHDGFGPLSGDLNLLDGEGRVLALDLLRIVNAVKHPFPNRRGRDAGARYAPIATHDFWIAADHETHPLDRRRSAVPDYVGRHLLATPSTSLDGSSVHRRDGWEDDYRRLSK
jgi:hypothetical protein